MQRKRKEPTDDDDSEEEEESCSGSPKKRQDVNTGTRAMWALLPDCNASQSVQLESLHTLLQSTLREKLWTGKCHAHELQALSTLCCHNIGHHTTTGSVRPFYILLVKIFRSHIATVASGNFARIYGSLPASLKARITCMLLVFQPHAKTAIERHS